MADCPAPWGLLVLSPFPMPIPCELSRTLEDILVVTSTPCGLPCPFWYMLPTSTVDTPTPHHPAAHLTTLQLTSPLHVGYPAPGGISSPFHSVWATPFILTLLGYPTLALARLTSSLEPPPAALQLSSPGISTPTPFSHPHGDRRHTYPPKTSC